MTTHKHLKARIRSRMQRTGESYTTARRHVLAGRPVDPDTSAGHDPDVRTPADAPIALPGLTPEATTLRVVLTNAGVTAPHTDRPWSEPMLLGLSGGIGVSVFSFRYEREDVSTLFVGARSPDSAEAMIGGLDLLGLPSTVGETTGRATAARRLRQDLEAHGPVGAWVDAATLGTRAMPASWEGGAYHVLAVLDLDDDAGTATVSDLADALITVDQAVLAAARSRIRKQRHRVLAVTGMPAGTVDLDAVVRTAVGRCHARLTSGRIRNQTVAALDELADRMHGSTAADGWARMFPPGRHLWMALTSLHDFVEHYGTGGGLSRPLYARFLREAAVTTDAALLDEAAERYEDLGEQWTALARAALPDDVAMLAAARRLQEERAARYAAQGDDTVADLQRLWEQMNDLGTRAAAAFPLSDADAQALRVDLADRTRRIAAAERAAAEVLARIGRT